jgi:hypothetical protein
MLMHWLTFIFGFLALYCSAGFIYSLATGGISDAHNAIVMFGVGVVIFALASFINQKRHSHAKNRAK